MPKYFLVLIWIIFNEKIVQYSITSPLEVKTLWNQLSAPLLMGAFQWCTKTMARGTVAWEISMWQSKKTRKLPSLIDRYSYLWLSPIGKNIYVKSLRPISLAAPIGLLNLGSTLTSTPGEKWVEINNLVARR